MISKMNHYFSGISDDKNTNTCQKIVDKINAGIREHLQEQFNILKQEIREGFSDLKNKLESRKEDVGNENVFHRNLDSPEPRMESPFDHDNFEFKGLEENEDFLDSGGLPSCSKGMKDYESGPIVIPSDSSADSDEELHYMDIIKYNASVDNNYQYEFLEQ